MWGKLINGVLQYAKSYLKWNGRKYWNAPEELWREAGWKTIIYGEYPEGFDDSHYTSMVEDVHTIVNTYNDKIPDTIMIQGRKIWDD